MMMLIYLILDGEVINEGNNRLLFKNKPSLLNTEIKEMRDSVYVQVTYR